MELTAESKVLVQQTCPYCKGTKVVDNPSWVEFNQMVKAKQVNPDNMEQWFRDRGEAVESTSMGTTYWQLPPEEIHCAECEGTGTISGFVTMKELAAFLKTL